MKPHPIPELSAADIIRFRSKVAVGDPDACWPWTGGRGLPPALPYGRFKVQRREVKAHRVAFLLEYGWEPEVGRHSCDFPPCCNPGHILDGTAQDNVHDRFARARDRCQVAGEHHAAKLTFEQAQEIRRRRADGEAGRRLADEFGVNDSLISRLVHGVSYTTSVYIPRESR